MRHGSLFSGIGGFDLAAEWMGWENVFHCEWNAFGQRVLKHYWPNAESFNDITKTDFTKYANKIDILTGGFPCQPYSSAGKRLGKEDERHLWPEMLRAIREISPSFVVGENVRGLTNWNGGLVFDEVCTELENLGYQVAPVIIPACGVGAPHRRERVWFVAENTLFSRCIHGENEQERTEIREFGNTCTGSADGIHISKRYASDTSDKRLQGSKFNGTFERREWHSNESYDSTSELHQISSWKQFPTQPPVCSGNDGIPNRLDGITFSNWRKESVKAYGNAIVPQVAYEIFKAITKTI